MTDSMPAPTATSESKTGIDAPTSFDVPKECKAGVVVNEGPDFHVEVRNVPVPEPGKCLLVLYLCHWTRKFVAIVSFDIATGFCLV